jgi:DNA replication and repair protein RecF
MELHTLRLQRFRNHLDSSFEFGSGTNVLLGDNGQGKTNIIEAISYLCLTKSFYAGSDDLVVSFGQQSFEVDGTFIGTAGNEHTVRVIYDKPSTAKVYSVNRMQAEPLSSVIGKFPVVVFSPEHTPITMGGPAERRRFTDLVISQSSAIYYQELLEYRRVVRHRNKILLNAKLARRSPDALLEPWDEQLVQLGSTIMHRRMEFVQEFLPYIYTAYHQLVGHEEEPAMEYRPARLIDPNASSEDIRQILREELVVKRYDEERTGSSLVGPHRDEFALKINNLDLRRYASQGQHKTFLVALKIGEFFYLKERCDEPPILLLDDVFTELDEHRSRQLMRFVEELSQTFITTTNPEIVDHLAAQNDRNRQFTIQNGAVVEQRTLSTT